jgi:hypothetical protein
VADDLMLLAHYCASAVALRDGLGELPGVP